MLSPTDVTSLNQTSATSPNAASKATLGSFGATKDQFLKLLLAQLKHQDPLQPPDASKFTEQMTSFGQLEQLMNLNQSMGTMTNAQNASNWNQSISLIGKKVTVAGNEIEVAPGTTPRLGFHNTVAAHDVTLVIKDAGGKTVRTVSYADQTEGTHFYDFDGKDGGGNLLPSGTYSMEAIGTTLEDEPVDVRTLMSGTVTSVDFSPAGPTVRVGSRPIALSDVLSVTN